MNEVMVKDNAVPAYLQKYEGPTGTETFDNEDINIPRIYLAQALSPSVKDGKINEGDLFLNVTETALAKAGEPLQIVPLVQSKEYILWRNRSDNKGGIMARATRDPNHPKGWHRWDKPNQTFETTYGKPPKKVVYETANYVEEDGLKEWGTAFPEDPNSPPAAAAHYNYIVMLPEHDNMIAGMSLSRTQLGRARDFNTMLRMKKVPIFSRIFAVFTEDDNRDAGEFKNYRFRPIGQVDDATFELTSSIVEGFTNVNVTFDESSDAAENDDL